MCQAILYIIQSLHYCCCHHRIRPSTSPIVHLHLRSISPETGLTSVDHPFPPSVPPSVPPSLRPSVPPSLTASIRTFDKMALNSFFHNKIESMKLDIIERNSKLRRLEAQRNDYNSRGKQAGQQASRPADQMSPYICGAAGSASCGKTAFPTMTIPSKSISIHPGLHPTLLPLFGDRSSVRELTRSVPSPPPSKCGYCERNSASCNSPDPTSAR